MNASDFIKYDSNQEYYIDDENKGNYWKLLDCDFDSLKKLNIYLPRLCKIISQISDINLKSKMKDKAIMFIKNNGVLKEYPCFSSGIFSEDEIKNIIENDIFISTIPDIVKNYNLTCDDKKGIYSIINLYCQLFDSKWEFNNLSSLIENSKDSVFFNELIVKVLETTRNYDKYEVFNDIFTTYDNLVPDCYKTFIKILNDKSYINDKIRKFEEKNITIGIDPNIKIGVEIETNHPYNLKFKKNNKDSILENYHFYFDPTVIPGIEVVSDPFCDNVHDVSMLCAICEVLNDMGYYYDEILENAAGQINFGLDYLDSTKSIVTFYEIFCNVEELLFYISNEEGQLIRQKLYLNSRFMPISEVVGTRIYDEDIQRYEIIQMFNSSFLEVFNEKSIEGLQYKKNSVCLRGSDEDDFRLEIRIPNGGNNYKTWIDNIRLYGKIVEVSKRIADILNKDYLTDDDTKLLNLKLELQNKDLELYEKLVLLMDLLFDDPSIKKIYFRRFDSVINKIKEYNVDKYNVPSVNKRYPMFDYVEFIELYKSKLGEPGNVSYDPNTGEYIEDGVKRLI